MHEYSLIANLLSKIQKIAIEESADKIVNVKVKLGALSHISADHFREHFVTGVKNTIADGANLEVEEDKDLNAKDAQDITLVSVDVE